MTTNLGERMEGLIQVLSTTDPEKAKMMYELAFVMSVEIPDGSAAMIAANSKSGDPRVDFDALAALCNNGVSFDREVYTNGEETSTARLELGDHVMYAIEHMTTKD